MDTGESAISTLNLSYVLHEPSTSVEVQCACTRLHAEIRRCAKATQELARASDFELLKRLVILDQRDSATANVVSEIQVVSLRIGAWELLPRLLRIATVTAPSAHVDVTFLDDPDPPLPRSLPLFRGMATLNLPARAGENEVVYLFASAVFRPGYNSILLRFNALDADLVEAANDHPGWRTATSFAETAIREYTYQWSCPRALWNRPAEDTLPEFESLGNGTVACGR